MEIKANNKSVECNVDFTDRLIKNKLIKLVKTFQSGSSELEKKVNEVENMTHESEIDKLIAISDAELDYALATKTKVCELLGDSTFYELFGSTVPAIHKYIPVLKQLVDVAVEESNEEKNQLDALFKTYSRGIDL